MSKKMIKRTTRSPITRFESEHADPEQLLKDVIEKGQDLAAANNVKSVLRGKGKLQNGSIIFDDNTIPRQVSDLYDQACSPGKATIASQSLAAINLSTSDMRRIKAVSGPNPHKNQLNEESLPYLPADSISSIPNSDSPAVIEQVKTVDVKFRSTEENELIKSGYPRAPSMHYQGFAGKELVGPMGGLSDIDSVDAINRHIAILAGGAVVKTGTGQEIYVSNEERKNHIAFMGTVRKGKSRYPYAFGPQAVVGWVQDRAGDLVKKVKEIYPNGKPSKYDKEADIIQEAYTVGWAVARRLKDQPNKDSDDFVQEFWIDFIAAVKLSTIGSLLPPEFVASLPSPDSQESVGQIKTAVKKYRANLLPVAEGEGKRLSLGQTYHQVAQAKGFKCWDAMVAVALRRVDLASDGGRALNIFDNATPDVLSVLEAMAEITLTDAQKEEVLTIMGRLSENASLHDFINAYYGTVAESTGDSLHTLEALEPFILYLAPFAAGEGKYGRYFDSLITLEQGETTVIDLNQVPAEKRREVLEPVLRYIKNISLKETAAKIISLSRDAKEEERRNAEEYDQSKGRKAGRMMFHNAEDSFAIYNMPTPKREALGAFLDTLTDDMLKDLVALAYFGRGDADYGRMREHVKNWNRRDGLQMKIMELALFLQKGLNSL